MNILIANISTFSRIKDEKEYKIHIVGSVGRSVKAFHTNESIFKALISLKKVKENGGIDKIISLVSNKAFSDKNELYDNKTAFEYYSDVVKDFSPSTVVTKVLLEDDNDKEKDVSLILDEICTQIDVGDIVYIDSAGGKRTTSNLIQLLAKLLKYKGIINPYTLYSDINGKEGVIVDTSEFEKMTNLADAFNEFMTSGKSNQLSDCFSKKDEKRVSNLVNTMTEFSDKIRLGDIYSLESILKELQVCITNLKEMSSTSDIEITILKQFLPIIQNKLLGTEKTGTDYLKIVQWCLDNGLIQQAVTIFVEKIPVYLIRNEIIKYYGNVQSARKSYQETRNKIQPLDWETEIFYSKILDIKNPQIGELKKYFETGKEVKSERCKKIVSVLKKIEKTWSSNLSQIDIPRNFSFLKENLINGKYTTFQKFKNAISHNDSLISKMLGVESSPHQNNDDETFKKKFDAVQEIKSGYKSDDFVFNATNEEIAKIYYSYLYAKSIRNKINHASSEDNLTSEQKKILASEGFDMNKISVSNVIRNLEIALDFIKDVGTKEKKEIEKQNDDIFSPTNLKIGDIVSAICTDIKIVRIPNYNYDIQLVLFHKEDIRELLNKEINVRIKQVSKAGKIIQVELP